MNNKANHAIFVNGYPYDLNDSGNDKTWDWLKERTILVRMYLNDNGITWTKKTGWNGSGDHCSWEGVGCSTDLKVEQLILDNNKLSGPFPSDLNNLGSLQSLSIIDNSLVGIIPSDLCTRSTSTDLHIYGDTENCPNDFDATTGVYMVGCCDNMMIDVDMYLNEFTTFAFGTTECSSLGGTEVNVCDYMNNKAN